MLRLSKRERTFLIKGYDDQQHHSQSQTEYNLSAILFVAGETPPTLTATPHNPITIHPVFSYWFPCIRDDDESKKTQGGQ